MPLCSQHDAQPPRRPQRRCPAHLPNVARHNQPVIIFVTVCTHGRSPLLAYPLIHDIIVAAWQMAASHHVGRYLLMPDHIHLFCSPAVHEAENVRDWTVYWKRLVSRALAGCGPLARFGRGGESARCDRNGAGGTTPSPDATERLCTMPGGARATVPRAASQERSRDTHPDRLWQRDCWDTQLRNAAHYDDKWQYVALNPVRKGLVQTPDEWPFHGVLHELRW